MLRGKFQRLGAVLGIIGITVLIGAVAAMAVAQRSDAPQPGRADVIRIDVLKAFGPLERPAVVFQHDRHTRALAKQKKDCLACHQVNDGRLVTKFKRVADTDRKTVMNTYHDQCISCHKDNTGKSGPSGPQSCGLCHQKAPTVKVNWQPIRLDASLHYRHVKANANKCEKCHHEYDTGAKKLFYAKGKEGSCRYCHKQETEENRISVKAASHQACVQCHHDLQAKDLDHGPVQCTGCHDPKEQQIIEKVKQVPRLERGQPDKVFVRAVSRQTMSAQKPQMALVAFDHKAHEVYNGSCQKCHHAAIQACADCHTMAGTKAGKQVKLAQAMHQPDTMQSCIGCHSRQQAAPQCAGCHAAIPKAQRNKDKQLCATCHTTPVSTVPAGNADAAHQMAAAQLAARQPVKATFGDDRVPEIVTIKHMVDQYGPVKMPHRKIVHALFDKMSERPLGRYFHRDPGTVCQGCHHNSPATSSPPLCSSCHGQEPDPRQPLKPKLLGAYHQQCLQCHEKMGLEKPVSRDCIACHPKQQG